MDVVFRLVGAFVVCFVVASVLFRILPATLRGNARIVAAHCASLVMLAVFVGLLRAYWSSFAVAAVVPYAIAQTVWLVIDLARNRR